MLVWPRLDNRLSPLARHTVLLARKLIQCQVEWKFATPAHAWPQLPQKRQFKGDASQQQPNFVLQGLSQHAGPRRRRPLRLCLAVGGNAGSSSLNFGDSIPAPRLLRYTTVGVLKTTFAATTSTKGSLKLLDSLRYCLLRRDTTSCCQDGPN
jgi:hypothetical protein